MRLIHKIKQNITLNNSLVLIAICMGNAAFAQTDLPSGKVEVIKSYDAQLLES